MKFSEIFYKIKSNKTLMNGTMFSVFSFINRGISFVLLIILAKYIMPAEYGKLSLFNTIIQLLGYFIAFSTQGYFAISFFQRKGELFRQDATSIIIILLLCTSVCSIILLFSQKALAAFAGLPTEFLWFCIIICLFQILQFLFSDYLRIKEKVSLYGLFSCSFALINFVLSIYLVVYKKFDWEGRVYSHLICSLLFGLLGLFFLCRECVFSRNVSWDSMKSILLWGIPLIPHEATTWIKQGGDRFIINSVHSIEDVGIFSFALTLTGIIIMIGIAFNATNSVSIYQILSSEISSELKRGQLKRQTKSIGLIYTVGYLCVVIFCTLLIPIFLPKYNPCLPYFWITSISGYLQCLYFLFVNYLLYYHKNQNIMTITFISALAHLGLSLLLTRYSLYWTAVIYVITQLLILLLIVMQVRKTIREVITDKKLIN